MVSAGDVILIYECLSSNGFHAWLTGGWGIDALLENQTRPHKDLDVFLLLDDLTRVCRILSDEDYDLKELWSENQWVLDAAGTRTATAFVLKNKKGCEIDIHGIRLDGQGNGYPSWEAPKGLFLTRRDLGGMGRIAGSPVHCISPDTQMRFHTGYELPDVQIKDLKYMHDRLGIEYPDELKWLRSTS